MIVCLQRESAVGSQIEACRVEESLFFFDDGVDYLIIVILAIVVRQVDLAVLVFKWVSMHVVLELFLHASFPLAHLVLL